MWEPLTGAPFLLAINEDSPRVQDVPRIHIVFSFQNLGPRDTHLRLPEPILHRNELRRMKIGQKRRFCGFEVSAGNAGVVAEIWRVFAWRQ